MSRLWTSGWEIEAMNTSSNSSPDGIGVTGVVRDTAVKRSGAASLKLNSVVLVGFGFAGVLDRGYWSRVYVLVGTLPTSTATILQHGNTAVQMDTAGQIFTNLNSATKSAAINDGNWHRVELYTKPSATAANRAWELRLDGTTISSGTSQSTDSSAYFEIDVGGAAAPAVLNFDDLAINDDQGASQNSWPGPGSVLLLVPTADSAVGTGWTLGTGTAISGGTGKTAVSNRPPLGVADLAAGSDVKQIRNAASAANSNYDATMTTYTAAGIGASDTINTVVAWAATGAPVTTSSKQGTVGIVSNPAVANVALAAQGTAGAFWAGLAAGTFTSGWKWSAGTVAYAPSVTLGTAPVMRITQVTSSTRIAMVCFMGIYVDYTPAAGGNTYTKAGYGRESL